MRVNSSGGLSEEEIRKLMQEAEANAELDRTRMKLVEARNAADQVIYDASKVLETAMKKLERESWEELDNALVGLRQVRDGSDRTKIAKETARTSELVSQVARLLEVLDRSAPSGGSASGDSSGDENIYVLEEDPDAD